MAELKIGNTLVGEGKPCFIIAEVGINHNGDIRNAKKLIDAAARIGCDCVKFQKRKLSETYQQSILDQPRHGEQGLQYILPLLIEFELSDDEFRELAAYSEERGILFLCTPWDMASVDFLESLRVPAYKIGSPDMTNFPLIEYVAATGKPFLVSTGMSTEDEIRRTLDFLRHQNARCGLFHCVSTYPVSPDEINLRFMQVLREWTGWPVGYSGHETGLSVSLAAVALGACMIERHLTLDRTMRGPDHAASLEPEAFAELVRGIRDVEMALGVGHRWMTRGEVLNRRVLGKSLVAATDIPAGVTVTRAMVTSKSPGMGLSAQRIDQVIGRSLSRPKKRDDVFVDEDLGQTSIREQIKSVDVGTRWGIIARFNDLDQLLPQFDGSGMSLVEFHISDRDLDVGLEGFRKTRYPFDLVVHAPEYAHDKLIDFCSTDQAQREMSVARIQKVINLVRNLSEYFEPTSSRGPKIVFHVGGMSPTRGAYDQAAASQRLLDSVRQLDHSGVDLLLENLPPFPWYFGGKWFGHVLTDSTNTVELCEATGLGLCFDTSHAGLHCNHSGEDLVEFARRIGPYVRHLHVSDAAGTGGEGLQIGEGDINFVQLMPVLLAQQPTMVPEIWMGHHQEGRGFQLALERLTEIVWAICTLKQGSPSGHQGDLESLIVPSSATILKTLQTIDANRMGIAFILDEKFVVLGVVTDGDIRHGLVQGHTLHSPIIDVMTRDFVFGTTTTSPAELRSKLPGRTRILPIVDASGRLTDFASGLTV